MAIRLVGLAIATLLAGCNGSSSSDDNPPPIGENELTIVGEQSIQAGDGASFYAKVPDETSRNYVYRWEQISGPELTIINPVSPVASFAAEEVGSYQLQVTVGGQTETIDFSIDGNDDEINVYSDQQVVSGGRVSLRAEAIDNFANSYPTNLSWSQLSGPSVTDLASQEAHLATFTAPFVTKDTMLEFELTGSTANNEGKDTISILVTAEKVPVTDAFFDESLARVAPYKATSPWFDALNSCIYTSQINVPCSVDELPLIGQVTSDPTIDDILDRVVVSHPWMGQQFEAFLRQHDRNGDFRTLLSSVTAIVISSDVRPSFYWIVTGAIYLDPENLWQQPWQRYHINEDPDYRSGFGSELNFMIPWRYVKDNAYASVYYPPGIKIERPWEQIEPDLASLLYHELAHANDYFPRSIHGSISQDSLLEEFIERINNSGLASDMLNNSYPLNSTLLTDLAQVSFAGADVDEGQKLLRPDDVAAQFFSDRASDYYAYSSTREDLAMLFEETAMQLRYDIYRDVAVTSPRSNNAALDLIVAKGQRSRIGDDAVLPRAQFVFDMLLPEFGDLNGQLSAPQEMIRGLDWFEAINIPNAIAVQADNAPPQALTSSAPAQLQGRSHFSGRHQGHSH